MCVCCVCMLYVCVSLSLCVSSVIFIQLYGTRVDPWVDHDSCWFLIHDHVPVPVRDALPFYQFPRPRRKEKCPGKNRGRVPSFGGPGAPLRPPPLLGLTLRRQSRAPLSPSSKDRRRKYDKGGGQEKDKSILHPSLPPLPPPLLRGRNGHYSYIQPRHPAGRSGPLPPPSSSNIARTEGPSVASTRLPFLLLHLAAIASA